MPNLKRRDHGVEVLALQKDLLTLGYQLPKWGADGHLGHETLAAVIDFEEDHGLTPSPPNEVSAATADAIHSVATPAGRTSSPVVLDATGQHAGTQRKRSRSWKDVTGITLHQTACVLGEEPAHWYSLRAHIGVTAQGQIILVNPLSCVVYHGNGFNSGDVGIEVDGMFEGIEGNPSTFWRPASRPDLKPMQPTAVQIDACRRTVTWIRDEVARHGGQLRFIHAHRMASADRQGDPGSRLWQDVGIWARENLGLDDQGAGFRIGSGLPIPEAWDSGRHGTKY